MKKEIKVLIGGLAFLSGIGIILSAVSCYVKNRTVTIIGSADGPTSIFLTGKTAGNTKLYIGTVLLTVTTVVFAMIMKHKGSGEKKGK